MRSERYVQSHTIDSPLNDAIRVSRSMQPEFDGVAEVWFSSEQDLMEAMGTSEMQELSAELLQDEASFVDHTKSCAFIVQEREL
ncbi:EthD domain-containing protein [Ruegeria arenilitoris]|uniref:EthD domain-containing protein n=1 Tax=Ruegeria arenilitoris TaxID=1173585 RepID=UPI001C2BB899|nr:EthD domain-containing protein [Ruegeria arenilitoris]